MHVSHCFLTLLLICSTATNLHSQWNKIYHFSDQMNDIWFVNKDTGYVAGSEEVPVLMKTTNGGYTWQDITGTIDGRIYAINFTGVSTGFISYYGTDYQYHLCQTKDAGLTWTDKYATSPYIFTIGFGSADVGYAIPSAMEYWDVVKTTNNGDYWSRYAFFQAAYPLGGVPDCSFPDATNGYFVTGHGAVYRTSSGGSNWNKMFGDATYSMSGVYFRDLLTGYVTGYVQDCYGTGNCGLVLKTTDGGLNWQQTTFNDYCLDLCFVTSDTGYMGNAEGIFKTTNAGEVWKMDTSNYHGYTFKIRAATKDIIYALAYGDQGTCLMKRDPDIGVSTHNLTKSSRLSAFPVPANSFINLSFNIPLTSEVTIDILNNYGIRQIILYNGFLSVGHHNFQAPVKDLPAGIYYCRLITSDTVTTKKIVVIR